jgi:hypothetical protein
VQQIKNGFHLGCYQPTKISLLFEAHFFYKKDYASGDRLLQKIIRAGISYWRSAIADKLMAASTQSLIKNHFKFNFTTLKYIGDLMG